MMTSGSKFVRAGSAFAFALALASGAALAQSEEPAAEGQTLEEMAPAAGTEAIDEATQASITSSLEAQGYTDVANFAAEGENFRVDAMKDGLPVQLVVDATGAIVSTN
jgi:acyl CoA:acetate/3-ketoacid CoA transferase beta subunit